MGGLTSFPSYCLTWPGDLALRWVKSTVKGKLEVLLKAEDGRGGRETRTTAEKKKITYHTTLHRSLNIFRCCSSVGRSLFRDKELTNNHLVDQAYIVFEEGRLAEYHRHFCRKRSLIGMSIYLDQWPRSDEFKKIASTPVHLQSKEGFKSFTLVIAQQQFQLWNLPYEVPLWLAQFSLIFLFHLRFSRVQTIFWKIQRGFVTSSYWQELIFLVDFHQGNRRASKLCLL